MQRFMKLNKACQYLDKSEPNFNETVRPFITEIRDGRCVKFDRLDLDAWADQYKAANGRPGKPMEETQCQNQPQASEKEKVSGISKKLSPASQFTKALANLSA